MKLITWNVQWCRGVDERVDPARIIAEAQRLADFDVLCLQEIADNYPDPRLGAKTAAPAKISSPRWLRSRPDTSRSRVSRSIIPATTGGAAVLAT